MSIGARYTLWVSINVLVLLLVSQPVLSGGGVGSGAQGLPLLSESNVNNQSHAQLNTLKYPIAFSYSITPTSTKGRIFNRKTLLQTMSHTFLQGLPSKYDQEMGGSTLRISSRERKYQILARMSGDGSASNSYLENLVRDIQSWNMVSPSQLLQATYYSMSEFDKMLRDLSVTISISRWKLEKGINSKVSGLPDKGISFQLYCELSDLPNRIPWLIKGSNFTLHSEDLLKSSGRHRLKEFIRTFKVGSPDLAYRLKKAWASSKSKELVIYHSCSLVPSTVEDLMTAKRYFNFDEVNDYLYRDRLTYHRSLMIADPKNRFYRNSKIPIRWVQAVERLNPDQEHFQFLNVKSEGLNILNGEVLNRRGDYTITDYLAKDYILVDKEHYDKSSEIQSDFDPKVDGIYFSGPDTAIRFFEFVNLEVLNQVIGWE